MKNAFSRIGRTCAHLAVAGGLVAGAMFAGAVNEVSVTLPHAVTVGSTTLPSGQYTILSVDMSDGDEYFVVRSANGPVVAGLQAQRTDPAGRSGTQVVLSKDGDTWHFDKMFVDSGAGYQFINQK